VQAAGEMVDRRALHDRVVDVEEGSGQRIGFGCQRHLNLGRRRGRLTSQNRA